MKALQRTLGGILIAATLGGSFVLYFLTLGVFFTALRPEDIPLGIVASIIVWPPLVFFLGRRIFSRLMDMGLQLMS